MLSIVAAEMSVTWERVPIGSDSLVFGSSYTGCVHMVALNETDLCIANLWVTSQRLLIHSAFTSTIYSDDFRLVVRISEAVDFWDKFLGPVIKTFSRGAWLLIVLTITGASLAMVVVEGSTLGDGTDQILDVLATQPASRVGRQGTDDGTKLAAMGRTTSKDRAKQSTQDLRKHALASLFYGWLGATSGTPRHEASTWPGRLVLIGFSFFFLIVFFLM